MTQRLRHGSVLMGINSQDSTYECLESIGERLSTFRKVVTEEATLISMKAAQQVRTMMHPVIDSV
jgi:hypothetical protein